MHVCPTRALRCIVEVSLLELLPSFPRPPLFLLLLHTAALHKISLWKLLADVAVAAAVKLLLVGALAVWGDVPVAGVEGVHHITTPHNAAEGRLVQ